MTQHLKGRGVLGVICEECRGRNYADPTKTYHYPECSEYTEWRFGPSPRRFTIPTGFGSLSGNGEGPCPHGYQHWTDCQGCTDLADFDDGGPE